MEKQISVFFRKQGIILFFHFLFYVEKSIRRKMHRLFGFFRILLQSNVKKTSHFVFKLFSCHWFYFEKTNDPTIRRFSHTKLQTQQTQWPSLSIAAASSKLSQQSAIITTHSGFGVAQDPSDPSPQPLPLPQPCRLPLCPSDHCNANRQPQECSRRPRHTGRRNKHKGKEDREEKAEGKQRESE